MTESKSLKSGWKIYRFDQMAINVNERIKDPSQANVDYYVGLEHLDPDSLKIRRWGSPSDVEATKLLFRKGDIIFGRRRVYQRKVAVADFDGICSAHALVLRANSKVVIPDFLPFFMQSDLFMERAKDISVGSLSPTINWKILAKQEFALPPIEEQKKLVNTFSCLETTNNALNNTFLKAKQLSYALFNDFLNQGWVEVNLGKVIINTQYGLSLNAVDSGKYPILRMMNLEDGRCVENDIKYVELSDQEFENYKLVEGDVLFNRTNSYELVGRTGIYTLKGKHVFASYLVRIKVEKSILDPHYLTLFLNSDQGHRQVLSFATRGVSQANVNATNLLMLKLPLPPIEKQQQILVQINKIEEIASKPNIRIVKTTNLKRFILDNMKSGNNE